MNLDTLLPDVLPYVLPCPTSITLDALRRAALDFCKTSEAWREHIDATVITGMREIVLTPSHGGKVMRVMALHIDCIHVPHDEFSFADQTITLHSRPGRNAMASALVSLGPTRTGCSMPSSLLDEWGETIASGAISRLKGMSGKEIEWSDPQGASYHQQLFDEGTARARIQVLRGDRGGGGFFIRDGGFL